MLQTKANAKQDPETWHPLLIKPDLGIFPKKKVCTYWIL